MWEYFTVLGFPPPPFGDIAELSKILSGCIVGMMVKVERMKKAMLGKVEGRRLGSKSVLEKNEPLINVEIAKIDSETNGDGTEWFNAIFFLIQKIFENIVFIKKIIMYPTNKYHCT